MKACAEFREQILRSWVEDSAPGAAGDRPLGDRSVGGQPVGAERVGNEAPAPQPSEREASGIAAHIESCPDCRKEALALRKIDLVLTSGFTSLGEILGPPSDRLIEETVRRVREVPPELELIRRVRRPVRIILWGVFYAFTLLACYALAVALLKALKGV